MRTLAERIAKYDARMQSSLIDPTLSAVNAQQKANFAAYEADFYPLQVAARAVLAGYSIPTPMYLAFEAYIGEIYALTKRFSGTGLTAAAQVITTKWADAAHLGVGNGPVLIAIADTVFGLTVV
jgi:hypothetical protein